MAQDTQQSTFSQLLGRSLLMAIPGTLAGVGQGIANADPRRPYQGFGAGLSTGIAPMAKFAGGMIERDLANDQYVQDTERLLERQRAVRKMGREEQAADIRAARDLEAEQAARDAERFRKIKEQDGLGGISIGMKGLDDQAKMFAAQFAASQAIPNAGMRMSGVQAARQILGGRS